MKPILPVSNMGTTLRETRPDSPDRRHDVIYPASIPPHDAGSRRNRARTDRSVLRRRADSQAGELLDAVEIDRVAVERQRALDRRAAIAEQLEHAAVGVPLA